MKLTLKNEERKQFDVERSTTKNVSISYEEVERELSILVQKEHELEQQTNAITTELGIVRENKKEFEDIKKEMDKKLP